MLSSQYSYKSKLINTIKHYVIGLLLDLTSPIGSAQTLYFEYDLSITADPAKYATFIVVR